MWRKFSVESADHGDRATGRHIFYCATYPCLCGQPHKQGKGKKDNTVPLPESILLELKTQMTAVGELHDKDLAAGYDGVFLDDAVETKYPKAPNELIHQWFFPM